MIFFKYFVNSNIWKILRYILPVPPLHLWPLSWRYAAFQIWRPRRNPRSTPSSPCPRRRWWLRRRMLSWIPWSVVSPTDQVYLHLSQNKLVQPDQIKLCVNLFWSSSLELNPIALVIVSSWLGSFFIYSTQ